ncbi:hypothetical protein SO802_018624 [Lithocarpus litseifolius]|uniref:Uncharacterized protein n=1 Tax=Lithocarpus litseifolius TaxID=425828 RepID=A0AAW2CLS9_9ROSI
MEEHSDILKKMGSHLTKLEEAKLKKAAHVEIPDDEEVEGWDERDKVDYERNKQFEKLTMETMVMKEKMEKMQLAFPMEEYSDVLKKMGIRLTKLEEAKLKKAAHVEIPNDKEMKGWDERDKADYERN